MAAHDLCARLTTLTDFIWLPPATKRTHTRQEPHKHRAPAPRTPELYNRDVYSHHTESNALSTELPGPAFNARATKYNLEKITTIHHNPPQSTHPMQQKIEYENRVSNEEGLCEVRVIGHRRFQDDADLCRGEARRDMEKRTEKVGEYRRV